MVEHRGADVVQVAQQGEDAAPLLVVPNLDLVVITTWAIGMEEEG